MTNDFIFNLLNQLLDTDNISTEIDTQELLPRYTNHLPITPTVLVLQDLLTRLGVSPFNFHLLSILQQALRDEDYIAAHRIRQEFMRFHCLDEVRLHITATGLFKDLHKALEASHRFKDLSVCAESLAKWWRTGHVENYERISCNVNYIAANIHSTIIDEIEDEAIEMILEAELHPSRLADLAVVFLQLIEPMEVDEFLDNEQVEAT